MEKMVRVKKNTYSVRGKVWLYPGMSGWHFLTLPKKQSEKIKKDFGANSRGWGSLPVVVTICKTSWKTSIFPDKREDAYLLPLKAQIRKKEAIYVDDIVTFTIELIA
jgi:hypothetical protein